MNFRVCSALVVAFLIVATPLLTSFAAESSRARDLGIPFGGLPGPLNAITDVAGVEVGHVTLFTGNGALRDDRACHGRGSRRWNGNGV